MAQRSATESQATEAFGGAELVAAFGDFAWQENHLDALPAQVDLSGRGWNAYYWPSFRGGLTARFFGETQSPLEKFEAAFEKDLLAANSDYGPGDLMALELKRVEGVTKEWFGVCDGSSEASLTFDEPTTTKVVNGVTFRPFEIKALLSYFTAMSSEQRKMMFAGDRIEFENPNFDAEGRGVDTRFRDVNPGLFHLVLANYLGGMARGVVADVVPGDVVLNFPIKGFNILSRNIVEDPSELAMVQAFNPDAARFEKVKLEVSYGESHRVLEPLPGIDSTVKIVYDYVIELGASGEIVGGEWLGESRFNHPDFLWLARDSSFDLEGLDTGRLGKAYHVGQALGALLAAPGVEDSAEIARRAVSDENLAGYRIFEGAKIPPTPTAVAALINR